MLVRGVKNYLYRNKIHIEYKDMLVRGVKNHLYK